MVSVRLFGVEKVQKMLFVLPKEMEKEIDKAEGEFIAFIQKSAKLRAPRITGALAASIDFSQTKVGTWKLVVDSPYGWFQEYGFKPHVVADYFSTRAGGMIMSDIYGEFGAMVVAKNTPFVEPALSAGLGNLPTIMQKAAYKAAKESAK